MAGKAIKMVITQNIDGLHRLSGIQQKKLQQIRGDAFLERCSGAFCGKEVPRPFCVPDPEHDPEWRRLEYEEIRGESHQRHKLYTHRRPDTNRPWEGKLRRIFDGLDRDGGGDIDLEELITAVSL